MAVSSRNCWLGLSIPQSQKLLLVQEQQETFSDVIFPECQGVDSLGPDGPSVSEWIKGKGKDTDGGVVGENIAGSV